MTRHLVAVLAVTFAVACSPAASAEPPPDHTYRNATYHWSITYPDGYTIDTTAPEWIKLRAFEPPREIGVHSFMTDRFTSADELADWQVNYDREYFEKQNLKLVVVSRRQITLPNNIPAVDVVKEMLPANGDRAGGGCAHDVYVLQGQRLFGLSAETYLPAWDAVAKEFDRILNSFTVETPD